MKNVFHKLSIITVLLTSWIFTAQAHNPDKYSKTSRLASGRWVKIEVATTGMQFVSNSVISGLGLDPGSTNVYGYGGRQIPEAMKASEPDDLPLLPSVRVDGGLIFFGTDNVTWIPSAQTDGMTYSHLTHPYSQTGYYFLSDRSLAEGESAVPAKGSYDYTPGTPERTTFRARTLHETELTAPSTTGRLLLGEDFRLNNNQTFTFALPGNTGGTTARIRMGASVSGGSASMIISANGKRLPATDTDIVPAITDDSRYLQTTSTVKNISDAVSELRLGINCSLSGMATIAALDYIEVEYDRRLTRGEGWIHFYDVIDEPTTFTISACNNQTRIWDVTEPSRPIEVNATLNGSTMRFTETRSGLREYVAFNPTSAGCNALVAKEASAVANQDLHGLANPHMLIIAPLRYTNQANELAEMHRKNDSMTVHVLTPDVIYNEFSSGTPDVGAFRKLLKMWADRAVADNTLPYPGYCLLLGRATFDNKHITQPVKQLGYPTVPIWQSANGYTESSSYSTDDYIGMTDDSDDSFSIGSQKIRTAVGRLPVKSEAEASTMVEKIKDYVTSPSYGTWRNNVMIIADDQDRAQHLLQAEAVYTGMTASGNGDSFVYEKLYLDSYPLVATATGDTYPPAKARMLQKWNEGVSWIQYIGHANPRGWGHEQLLTWTDINGFSNQHLPFLYAATCSFARHDALTPSGAEEMLLNPDGGIIGTICPSRTVYIPQNGTLTKTTSYEIYGRDSEGKARRTGEIMIAGKNNYPGNDENKLKFSFLGDPAIRVPSPEHRVVVENIGETPVEDIGDADLPVISARSKVTVKGRIEGPDGQLLSDYNGELHATLYDAERVITTNGNGKDGVVEHYNDRKTRLYSGATHIKNGRWEIKLLMPAEIENNWSPAQFTLYAYSDNGREANGACDRLYVYGIDPDAPEDNEGPGISRFTLNDDSFEAGDITHSSPVVLATVSDASGINISDAGIGHKMLLTLDSDTHYNDLGAFYTPDPDIEGGGRITYPLSGLAPGDHELKLTVWDNANNSSSRTLPFRVGLNQEVDFIELLTDANPAHEKVTFTLKTDRIKNQLRYTIEVYNLNGHLMWSSGKTSRSRNDGSVRQTWYLEDSSGTRVNRGIYLCRATVECEEGVKSSKTVKLAVSAK